MAYDEKQDTTAEEDSDSRTAEVRKKWREAKEALSDWRTEARRCYAFRDGDQWEETDRSEMKKEQRPALTFNRIGAMVDSVSGIEINNRQEVHYYPRTMEDVRVNEIYTEAGKWARDNCYADDEESDAFKDATTCGIGLTETLMDYEVNQDGDLKILRRDPLKAAWSPYACQKGLEDAQEVFYADYMKKSDVEKRWETEVLYSDEPADSNVQHQADRVLVYDEDSWADDKQKGQVLVLHYQCYKLEDVYRAADPFTGQEVKYDKKGFEEIQEKVKPLGMVFVEKPNPDATNEIRYVKQKTRVYYRGFYCGDKELEWGKLPVKDARGFTFRFITGKRDHVKKMWYGIVRPMIDPQQWGNKFLSLTVDIMARNAKGGVFVEENALKDPKKAEEDWATPSPFIMLNEGGLAKVQERQQSQYPTGWDRLMNFSFDALHWVSGLNPEALGMQDRAQAGVLEETRKRAALAILAPLFDSLKRYRKSQGYLMLAYIREFLSDGRIIRITGKPKDAAYMRLVKQDDTAEYDVVVDDAPTSPDFRDRVWQGLQPLIPALIKQGVPIPQSVIEYAPGISSEVATELQNAMQGVPPPQIAAKMQKMEQLIQSLGQELQGQKETNLQMKMDKSLDLMEMQRKSKENTDKLVAKMQEGSVNAQVDRLNAILEASVQRFNTIITNEQKDREAMLKAFVDLKTAAATQSASGGGEGDGGSKAQSKVVQIDFRSRDETEALTKAIGEINEKVVGLAQQREAKLRRRVTAPSGSVYLVEDV